MDEALEKLQKSWESDMTFLIEKKYDGEIVRLLKSPSGTYQLNRYVKIGNRWNVSVDQQDRDAEFMIRHFWDLYIKQIEKTMLSCLQA